MCRPYKGSTGNEATGSPVPDTAGSGVSLVGPPCRAGAPGGRTRLDGTLHHRDRGGGAVCGMCRTTPSMFVCDDNTLEAQYAIYTVFRRWQDSETFTNINDKKHRITIKT